MKKYLIGFTIGIATVAFLANATDYLNKLDTVSTTAIDSLFASPPALGSTVPAAVVGTTVNGTVITGNSFVPNSATVPSNGMFLSAANMLGFATNSTERWDINSSGHFVPTVNNTYDIGAVTMPRDVNVARNVTLAGALVVSTSASPLAADACTAGKMVWDASYIYVCTATGVWKRAALTGGY